MKTLTNIRHSSQKKRDKIVWICAAVVALVLLVAWLVIGNPKRNASEQNFFQSFNQGLDEGKTIPNPLEQ